MMPCIMGLFPVLLIVALVIQASVATNDNEQQVINDNDELELLRQSNVKLTDRQYKLESDLVGAKNDYKKANDEFQDAVAEYTRNINECNKKLDSCSQSEAALEEELSRAQFEYTKAVEQRNSKTTEIYNLSNKVTELEASHAEDLASITTLTARHKGETEFILSLEESLKERMQQMMLVSEELNNTSAALIQCTVEVQVLHEKVSTVEAQAEQQLSDIAALQEQENKCSAQMSTLRDENSVLRSISANTNVSRALKSLWNAISLSVKSMFYSFKRRIIRFTASSYA